MRGFPEFASLRPGYGVSVPKPVARMERSAIRGNRYADGSIPG